MVKPDFSETRRSCNVDTISDSVEKLTTIDKIECADFLESVETFSRFVWCVIYRDLSALSELFPKKIFGIASLVSLVTDLAGLQMTLEGRGCP